MENTILNNDYIYCMDEDLKALNNHKFDIDNNSDTKIIIKEIYKYFIKICEEKIYIENNENIEEETYFHMYFKNFNDMLLYNIFVENFVKYINKKINKNLVYSICNSGKSKLHEYSIRIDMR